MSPQSDSSSGSGIGIASMLFGMLGAGVSAYGQIEEGKAEQAAYDYNAAITLENMRSTLRTSQQKYSELVGRQATAYARAGVDVTSGSPLLIMAATAGRGGAQAAEINQAGNEQATLQKYYGKLAAWRGKMGGISTFLKGVSGAALDYLKINPSAPRGNVPTDPGFDPSI